MHRLQPTRHRITLILAASLIPFIKPGRLEAETRDVLLVHGAQTLSILTGRADGGARGVLVIASGDAGWRGLAKDLGRGLADRGYDVVGLDSKAYLTSGTKDAGSLSPDDVQRDYMRLVLAARAWFPGRPVVLAGVSEGAGLAILAAADKRVAAEIEGVVGLGTPDRVTLAWHFWNWTIWVTHQEPDEPSVATAPYLNSIAPTPILLVHSTHDEYVRVDLARELFVHAREPRRIVVLESENHSFGNAREALFVTLTQGLQWFTQVRVTAEVRP